MQFSTTFGHFQALSFVYPHGATLNVARPAVPVLSTGSVSFPLNRPVCALYKNPGRQRRLSTFKKSIELLSKMFLLASGGKLAVLGSGAMFSDPYLEKEDNAKIKVGANYFFFLLISISAS